MHFKPTFPDTAFIRKPDFPSQPRSLFESTSTLLKKYFYISQNAVFFKKKKKVASYPV